MADTTANQDKSLVLVLGAGASKEVNLPVGDELKIQIANALDLKFPDGMRRTSGDQQIFEAFRAARKNSVTLRPSQFCSIWVGRFGMACR